MDAGRVVPFVVDRWVRGETFYGRETHIREILDGPRDCLWLLGTRRIGRTSLLRHIERLVESAPDRGYVPVFWDLQGAKGLEDLSLAFHRSLSEARTRLDWADLRPTDGVMDDLFASIGRVRRHLKSRHLRLLLLCDGAEGLTGLGAGDPALLRKLRRAMQSGEDVRTVLASTIRLWALAEQKGDTSPFLHGFTPPLYLQALPDEEARSLILQNKLPSEARPAMDEAAAERIGEICGGHPYLLQLLCKRSLELGGVEEAVQSVASDSTLSPCFSSDFEVLTESDRAILQALAEEEPIDPGRLPAHLSRDSSTVKASLFRLESLGLVRRDQPSSLTLGNLFLRRWLATREPPSPSPPVAARATEIVADLSRSGESLRSSPDDLFEAVYDPLRALAGRYLRRERPGHTLQPTALVHEAYLKLIDQSRVDWRGRTHFFAVGAKIMRRLLIDHARSRNRDKRGGDRLRVTLTGLAGSPLGGDLDPTQLLALHSALEKLARIDERQARVVELRFFAGLNMSEVAEVLGVSKRTADGDWAKARLWLEQELDG